MSPERSPIVGVLQLTAYDDRASEADPWGATFGANPTGRAEYHPDGFLSIHIASAPDTPTVAPYFAYFGTWVLRETAQTVAGTSGVVEHQIIACTHPDWVEGDPTRPFLVNGDELMLGDCHTSRRCFVRLA